MINIRTLERIADNNNISVDIIKRDVPKSTLDYELGYSRQYDITGYDFSKFEDLLRRKVSIDCNFFFQRTFPGTLLTLTD